MPPPAWPFIFSLGKDMRKIDIINRIAAETGLTRVKAEKAVEAILKEIKDGLQRGEPVTLRRFGSFEVRDKRARSGRNPKTGEEAEISARRIVRFKSGQQLKEAVNASSSAEDAPMEASAP
jgi:DNA-binding protein HU-beta